MTTGINNNPVANPVAPAVISLYVGDLHPDVSEASLYSLFQKYKQVLSIRVCRDMVSKRSLGYAYVNFSSLADAEAALDEFNFEKLNGRPIRIMWSQRDPGLRKSGVGNIYIKNLDKSITQKEFYDTFATFGTILSCKIQTQEGKSMGFGFVHYTTEEAAAAAIKIVSGKTIKEKQVYVCKFVSKSQRGNGALNKYTNVYIKNFAQLLTKDEDLSKLFEKFGEIISAKVMLDKEGRSRGFGFVCFKTHEAAQQAVIEMDKYKLEDRELYVGRAMLKDERQRKLRTEFEKQRTDVSRYAQGVNLYVKNLHEDVNDEMLRETFSQFGTITSTRVMRISETNRSKGFGFVAFANPEQATKAVTDMRGHMLLGKPLYVSLAQKREERRSQLAQQYLQRHRPGMNQGGMYAPGIPAANTMMQMQYYPRQFPNPAAMPNALYYRSQPRWPAAAPQSVPIGHGHAIPGGFVQRQTHVSPGGPGAAANMMMSNQYNAMNAINQYGQQRPQQPQQMVRPQQQIAHMNPGLGQEAAKAPMASMPRQALEENASVTELEGLQTVLANMTPDQQKQFLGERLHPIVMTLNPGNAGKITGMLLDMDNGELLHLFENRPALVARIESAMKVWAEHQESENNTRPGNAAN